MVLGVAWFVQKGMGLLKWNPIAGCADLELFAQDSQVIMKNVSSELKERFYWQH